MQRKQRFFNRFPILTLVGFAAVAALDSGLFNAATFAPPSFSNVAFAADAYAETSARAEKTDAILALLDVPEGESGEFYRERLQELQNACARVLDFDAACYNLVRYRDENGSIQWRRAEPNSLENKVYVAARALYERLFDAPDIAPQIRDRYYFAKYLRDAYYLDRAEDADVQGWLDYCAERLALEEARESFPLGRVLALRRQISNAKNRLARKESGDEKKTFADFPALAALADDLAEKVELERLAAEAEAEAYEKIKAKAEAKGGTPQNGEEYFLATFILNDKLRAALPDLLAEERPAEETTEFYRQRKQELKQIVSKNYNVVIRGDIVSDFLAGKLAYAEDLAPVERFEAFQVYVGALGADLPRALWNDAETPSGVERLTALLEEETKRKAEHPADAARVPYLRERLFAARCQALLPKNAEETNASFSEEERAELERFAADALELLDDGPLPWTLGETWASTVLAFLRGFADRIDVDFATQLRKDVLARFPDSEKEANRELLAWTAKDVRDAELVGSQPEVAGRVLPNGETFDWASYRGAPVLVEIFRCNPGQDFPWQSNVSAFESDAFFQGCVDSGLKVIRYGALSYEDARRHYEATRPNKPEAPNAIFVDQDAPVVGPLEGREGNDDWALRIGVARFGRSWILFDADGRVVTTCPKPAGLKVYRDAPTLQEALQALYPNVDPKSDAKR